MATRDQLETALRNAHNAGDTDAAARIAAELKSQTQEPEFQAAGIPETALTVATSAIAEPVAGIAGLLSAPFVGTSGATNVIQSVRDFITVEPFTEAGTETLQATGQALTPIGEAFETVSSGLGDITFEYTGSPELAAAAYSLPTAALEVLGLKGAQKLGRGARQRAAAQAVSDADLSALSRIEGVEPAQIERLKQFQTFGTKPTMGQLTGKVELQKPEQQLLQSVESDAGGAFRQQILNQSNQIRAGVDKFIDSLGLPEESGSLVKSALSERKSTLKNERKAAYDALAQAQANIDDAPISTNPIAESLPDARDVRILQRSGVGAINALDDLLTEFGVLDNPEKISSLSSQGVNVQPVTLSNFEEFRRGLNDIQSIDPQSMTRIIAPIKKALDDEIDLATQSLEMSGDADLSNMAKQARQSNVALRTEFDEKALTEQLIKPKAKGSRVPNVEDSKVYGKLLARSTPIEQVQRVVNSISGNKKALETLQANVLLDLIDSAFAASSRTIDGQRVFGGAALQKRLSQIKDKSDIIFNSNPQAKKLIDDLEGVAKAVTPSDISVPKGSAGFLIDALRKTGIYAAGSKVPGGELLFSALDSLGTKATNKKALEKALKTRPQLAETKKLIEASYPALAAVLLAGQTIDQNKEGEKNGS